MPNPVRAFVAAAIFSLATLPILAQSPVPVVAGAAAVAMTASSDSATVVAGPVASALPPDETRTVSQMPLITTAPSGVTSRNALRDTMRVALEPGDTVPRRRAVAYSDWYSRRLTIHRYGSYIMLPLFATQYVLGNKLLNQKEALYAGERAIPVDKNLRSRHAVVAGAVGTLFVVNTTTGVWNLIESRHTEEGRTRRTIHALTMLAADAGFAYTGVLGSRATDRGPPQGRAHRNAALTSFGISTAGAALMWIGNRD